MLESDVSVEELPAGKGAAPRKVPTVNGVGSKFDIAQAFRLAVETPAPMPVKILTPPHGWRLRRCFDLWTFRELVYFLAWRDVKVRYKQTVLGAAWAVLQPLMTMVVFTVFFGRLGRMEQFSNLPYPVIVFSALLPWQFFSQAVVQSGQSLVGSANLISKVYFPRLAIPLAVVGGTLVDFGISFVVMFALMLFYGVAPGWGLLLLPVLVALTLLAVLGVGSLLSSLTVAYRDFRYVAPFLIQLWFFACPVAYPLQIVPEAYRQLYAINPMAGIIEGYRSALLGQPIAWDLLAISGAASLCVFAIGIAYFLRVERRFADIV
jgi:ABC-type polysaccharide/polyol phosphate export systems, permease component